MKNIPDGWWKVENEYWLTIGALKNELQLKPKQLKEKIAEINPTTKKLENPHNHHKFTAYKATDFKIWRDPTKKEKVW